MKTRLNYLLWAMLITTFITGCVKEQDPIIIQQGPYVNGVFITNEGTFGQENASVSFYDFAGDSIQNLIYSKVNKNPLGKVLQSMYITGGKAFMMCNLSDTVFTAYTDNFIEGGFVAGLSSPRYMTSYNGKGYITQWGENGVVKVFDLSTNNILRTVKVGMGPEQAIVANGSVLVCNGGAYDHDSTISVIDPVTDKVVQTVFVGDNPKEMVMDKNNDIWVICFGLVKYDSSFSIIAETPSKLVRLSGQTFEKTGEYIISATKHPQHIDISKDKSTVYFGGGFGFAGIFALDVMSLTMPVITPLIDETKFFYGFNVNPVNGEIYALDATDYTTPGILRRYSAQGTLIKQYSVGIAPNGAVFK
jgi:YVTN family beta-propeller protein